MANLRVDEWLRNATTQLADADILTARLDSLVLLEDHMNRDRSWLLAHPEHILHGSDLESLSTKLSKRIRHMPLAYIRGKAEFYGREFIINTHTLVPRPETEKIIDLLKELDVPNDTSLLDVGTGSGCIAITAALELPNTKVSACDIDERCLGVATENAVKLGANVIFFKSNLIEQAQAYDILVANLPYVPDDFPINQAASHEPRRALFGGSDGLDLYRKLFENPKLLNTHPRYMLIEALPEQHDALAKIAKVASFVLRKTDDFIQLFEFAH
jgi:release factor glutamine methyltransferase